MIWTVTLLKGVFLLGHPTCPRRWLKTDSGLSLFHIGPGKPEEWFSSSQSESQPLGLTVFSNLISFSWFCQDGLTYLTGTDFLKICFLHFLLWVKSGWLPPFLYSRSFHFSSRPGNIQIVWRYLGSFLVLCLLFILHWWVHFNLPFHLTTNSRRGICSEASTAKWWIASGGRITHSFTLVLGSHCTTLYSTSATIFFF